MDEPEPQAIDSHGGREWRRAARALLFVAILAVAAGLRLWNLDAASLWYDEIVTMRVARADGLAAMLERLGQIDGTRAPLHPLVLSPWLRVFGPSDLAGRAFSALCGLATVGVVYLIGRNAYDHRTGLWSAWLTAVCPPLVYYSQEARMYAWLVLLTALSWLVLLSFRQGGGVVRCVVYGLLLAALAYSHPLGLFMIAAHGLAYLLAGPGLVWSCRVLCEHRSLPSDRDRCSLRPGDSRPLHLSPVRWQVIQLGVVLAIAPWLRRYLDHATDYPMPRYAIRYLLAVPIEYVGGNSLVLLVCLAIIAVGLVAPWRKSDGGRHRPRLDQPAESLMLIVWAAVPPAAMYAYSWVGQPIFGPSRYHLFSAPAYLILLARGLTRLPPLLRWPLAAAGLALSLTLLHTYSPTLKADWRGLAGWLNAQDPQATQDALTVVVHPSDPRFPREPIEAARYYLAPRYRVVAAGSTSENGPPLTYDVYCLTQPQAAGYEGSMRRAFYGLILK